MSKTLDVAPLVYRRSAHLTVLLRLGGPQRISVTALTSTPRWFCDITLRRLAKTLSLGARHREEYEPAPPETESQEQQEEGSSGWGAAAAAATGNSVAREATAGSGTPGAGVSVSGEHHRTGLGGRAASGARCPGRFRTFTVVCARTAVTEKGARAAEAISPGLLVVLEEDQPTA